MNFMNMIHALVCGWDEWKVLFPDGDVEIMNIWDMYAMGTNASAYDVGVLDVKKHEIILVPQGQNR